MEVIRYEWAADGRQDHCDFAFVRGTDGVPYSFGDEPDARPVEISEFFIGTKPVSQSFWAHVMGVDTNPAVHRGQELPVENVSWVEITSPDGFLDRLNHGPGRDAVLAAAARSGPFRLPSETEWEYAARGGPHWRDGTRFSGSDDVEAVAWYDRRHGDHTQPLGLKAPNQLGVYDMSGNVWEWCQDVFTRDVVRIPQDGRPFLGDGEERVLRGGCFHNWAAHCTVSKRYEIEQKYRDGCIGLRLVFTAVV